MVTEKSQRKKRKRKGKKKQKKHKPFLMAEEKKYIPRIHTLISGPKECNLSQSCFKFGRKLREETGYFELNLDVQHLNETAECHRHCNMSAECRSFHIDLSVEVKTCVFFRSTDTEPNDDFIAGSPTCDLDSGACNPDIAPE